jgi:hypothetical protein
MAATAPVINIRSFQLSPSLPKTPTDYLQTNIPFFDARFNGLPKGSLTELSGPSSTGKTSLIHAALAECTQRQEYCAYIDGSNTFSPTCAHASQVDLAKLIWVRCTNNLEAAFQAADLLTHSGGLRLIVMDIANIPQSKLNHIPVSWWHRFRLAVQDTPACFVLLSASPQSKSSSQFSLLQKRQATLWQGEGPGRVFAGLQFESTQRKPPHRAAIWEAKAV